MERNLDPIARFQGVVRPSLRYELGQNSKLPNPVVHFSVLVFHIERNPRVRVGKSQVHNRSGQVERAFLIVVCAAVVRVEDRRRGTQSDGKSQKKRRP